MNFSNLLGMLCSISSFLHFYGEYTALLLQDNTYKNETRKFGVLFAYLDN